jgi:hypothetical protein
MSELQEGLKPGHSLPFLLLTANFFHIPSDLVVECVTAHRKPPEVRFGH